MEDWLKATRVFDFDDPRVMRKALELASLGESPAEKVRVIAKFVREWIRLEIRRDVRVASASEVLCFMQGSAAGKAVLFTALCRANRIPCRIALQKLSGAPDRWAACGMMARIEWQDAHPINEVLLGDRWVAMDLSLDSESACRLGLMMPPILSGEDSTLREAVGWVPDALIRVEPLSAPDVEGIPAGILGIASTDFGPRR